MMGPGDKYHQIGAPHRYRVAILGSLDREFVYDVVSLISKEKAILIASRKHAATHPSQPVWDVVVEDLGELPEDLPDDKFLGALIDRYEW